MELLTKLLELMMFKGWEFYLLLKTANSFNFLLF